MFEDGKYPVLSAQELSESAWYDIKDLLLYDYQDLGLRENILNQIGSEVGFSWTGKLGNWPKRFAKVLKKNGIKLSNDALSKVGKIARESCVLNDGGTLTIETTPSWKPGRYGDYESCFWGCRSAARYIIMKLGGKALCLDDSEGEPVGRCWYVPYPKHNAHILFNAYSPHGKAANLITFSRIVSDLFNFPYYRDVELSYCGAQDGVLWINGSKGYIIGDQSISDIEEVDIDYPIRCEECGDVCYGSAEWVDGRIICSECDEDLECSDCGCRLSAENAHYRGPDAEDPYCHECFTELFTRCNRCGYWEDKRWVIVVGGESWCEECADEHAYECNICGSCVELEEAYYVDGEDTYVCSTCAETKTIVCDDCGDRILTKQAVEVNNNHWICNCCFQDNYSVCDSCSSIVLCTEMHGSECAECAEGRAAA